MRPAYDAWARMAMASRNPSSKPFQVGHAMLKLSDTGFNLVHASV